MDSILQGYSLGLELLTIFGNYYSLLFVTIDRLYSCMLSVSSQVALYTTFSSDTWHKDLQDTECHMTHDMQIKFKKIQANCLG